VETTLNKIRAHRPCEDGWTKLLTYLGKVKTDDEPLAILTILESNGLADALWCLQAVDGHDTEIRKLACDFALSVAHLWDMPDVARQYLETQDEEIRAAAWAAIDASWVPAARAAAWAAGAASWVPAAWAAGAARAAAWAAGDAEREKQETILRAMLGVGKE